MAGEYQCDASGRDTSIDDVAAPPTFIYDAYGRLLPCIDVLAVRGNMVYDAEPRADEPIIVPRND
jgi:hypothetical protein